MSIIDTSNNTTPICVNEPSTTLVTALYDIGRENLTGKNAHRSFAKYLNWFKHVLWMNVPMVIFIPENLRSYVLEHRPPNYPTRIVIRRFEDLDAYKYHDRIQSTIDTMVQEPNSNGIIPAHFSESPEFITAKYETIIFSKFDFLKEVSSTNPFNTEYFIWLDAGTFYQEPPFNYKLPWPDPYKMKILGDKFLVSDFNFNVQDQSPMKDEKAYLRLNRNEICAFVLGGNKIAIDTVHTKFWKKVDSALSMGVINNEQHFLQLMAIYDPEDYYIWYRTRYQYPNLPVPLRDRMIPAELAQGTFIGEKYPINRNVKVLTVATREIAQRSYNKWETSAKYYGYDYEVLGRDHKWDGYGTKIRVYHEALKRITASHVALTDCTDLFFCGSSNELYDKFIATGKDIIVGGEIKIYYPGGKHHINIMKNHFTSIKESAQAFPNSGFIMGKTSEVLRLMELHIDYADDQGACFDTIYENKAPLVIDYKTHLIGNVPNYRSENNLSVSYFEYDAVLHRYKNRTHNTTPVVLHFPGKNWQIMQEFYSNSQFDLTNQNNTGFNAGWIFIGIIIVIIFFIILTNMWVHSR